MIAPATNAREDGPQAWRTLAALAVAELLGMSLWFSATAVTPSLAADFHLSEQHTAWLTMAVQAGFVLGTLGTALFNLADAVNARSLLTAGCLIGAAANASVFVVTGPIGLLTSRLATGAALAWVYPPAMKIAASWFRLRRGSALGVLVGALTLGKATPHLVTALLGHGWQAPISWTSALAVIGALVTLIAVRSGPLVPATVPFNLTALGRACAVREVRMVTLGYLGHMWELYAMWAWIAVFAGASLMASGVSAPSTQASFVAFVAIGSGAAGCALAGRAADWWGKARVARAAMFVSGGCCLLTALAFGRHPGWLYLLVAVWGFSVVADSAQFSALASEHAPPDAIGTTLTLQMSLGFLLTMVTIDLLPRAAQVVGWQWAGWLLAVGPLAGLLPMSRLGNAAAARPGYRT